MERARSIETRDSAFQVSLEEENGRGHLVIRRQGPSGQELVQALTPEQIVETFLGIETAGSPAIPEGLRQMLEEQNLEIITETGNPRQTVRVSRHAEYKDSRNSGILKSASATGLTRAEAREALIRRLSGRLLVVDAHGANRIEIQMPEFNPDVESGEGEE